MRKIIPLLLLCLTGCASYNQHAACFNVSGVNLSTPYGPASGNARFCTVTCLGVGCPKADTQDIIGLTNTEITSSANAMGSIPVVATITPSKWGWTWIKSLTQGKSLKVICRCLYQRIVQRIGCRFWLPGELVDNGTIPCCPECQENSCGKAYKSRNSRWIVI